MVTALGDAAVGLIEENLTAVRDIVVGLGDELASTRPALAGANPPTGIAVHCAGLVNFWLGSVIGGEKIPRDRDSEFTTTGPVDEIASLVDELLPRVRGWVDIGLTEGARDRTATGSTRTADSIRAASVEWMLLHVVRELSQHLGQLELTRDVLMSSAGRADEHR
ncbi:mycothiol transferase [Williamsia deligens]|uniref:DUF664 domain-containing protein n=1 Tax=Williamsia deligens TaxID=321325 RepID=A0ABW3GC70_9NOCA|nr:DUF664 domain-containing protein [Williamsia deligens]MCP2195242.1 Protein of unknown function (DUF664) [Williamsia deligens]